MVIKKSFLDNFLCNNTSMCTSPNRVFYTGLKTENGKDLLFFDIHYPVPDTISLDTAERILKTKIPHSPEFVKLHGDHLVLYKHLDVPCGKCDACIQNRSRQWSYRLMMEAHYSHDCHFLTLTFDDNYCPKNVCRKDVTMFMKRLRRELDIPGVRFFACGEYGEKTRRPHYHIILFDCPLPDTYVIDASRGLYGSPVFDKCWPYGMHCVGEVTLESCNYVARYTTKKSTAKRGFLQMSRRPGIGYRYLLDHKHDLLCDCVNLDVNGEVRRLSPPRYMEKILPEIDWPVKKEARIRNAERSMRVLSALHGCSGTRLDDYLRGLHAALAQRKEKITL